MNLPFEKFKEITGHMWSAQHWLTPKTFWKWSNLNLQRNYPTQNYVLNVAKNYSRDLVGSIWRTKMEKSTFCFGLETVRTVIWCLVQNPWPVSYTLNWEVKLDITNLLYIRGGEKWWVKPFPVLHVAFEAFLLSREFGKIYSWPPLTYRRCLPCPSGALENVALPFPPPPPWAPCLCLCGTEVRTGYV